VNKRVRATNFYSNPLLPRRRFAFEGLAVNELSDVTFTCDDVKEGNPCTETGQMVLEQLRFKHTVFEVCVCLIIFTCVEHLIAYSILVRNSRKYMVFKEEEKEKK